ncbi:MAG TPA: AMP-binding protein, partial [Acidimicrobiales bacterium]|nr:AMP-binding protein [Acidimicrobiales bacterium]
MAIMSYGRRITQMAELDPERAAVTCGGTTLTRQQLEQRANRLAHDFLERGVELGDMVTIALPNSTDWYVAMAACWKVGAVPQPVSAKLPARELQAILELADPKLVVGVSDDLTEGRPALP